MMDIHTIKSIDKEAVIRAINKIGKIVTVEDHNIIGGLGSAVAEVIAECGIEAKFKRLGLYDFSKSYGTYEEVKKGNGIEFMDICRCIREIGGYE